MPRLETIRLNVAQLTVLFVGMLGAEGSSAATGYESIALLTEPALATVCSGCSDGEGGIVGEEVWLNSELDANSISFNVYSENDPSSNRYEFFLKYATPVGVNGHTVGAIGNSYSTDYLLFPSQVIARSEGVYTVGFNLPTTLTIFPGDYAFFIYGINFPVPAYAADAAHPAHGIVSTEWGDGGAYENLLVDGERVNIGLTISGKQLSAPSVPEPAVWCSMSLGFLLAGAMIRRRPKASSRMRMLLSI